MLIFWDFFSHLRIRTSSNCWTVSFFICLLFSSHPVIFLHSKYRRPSLVTRACIKSKWDKLIETASNVETPPSLTWMKGLGSISMVTSLSKGAFLALCGNCCSWFCIWYIGAARSFKREAMMNLQKTKNSSSIANLVFDLLVHNPPQFVLQHPRRCLAPFERPGYFIDLPTVYFAFQ